MGQFLKRNVGTIFIMLGNSCNMHCRYCLQHPLVEHGLSAAINPDICKFIEEVSSDKKEPLQLHFYGGEPLIYFKTMKEIIGNTKGMNVQYSTICNGKAITQEMVDLFNALPLHVAVSWDGKNVLQTRGYDVFALGSKTRDLLLQLKQLCVSGVISARNYPQEACDAFQELSKAYFDIHGYALSFNYDLIMDTGLGDKSLLAMDYRRVYDEVFHIMGTYLQYRMNKAEMKIAELAFIEPIFNGLNRIHRESPWNQQYCYCGNGYTTLNMDLAGNLYPCHNTSQKAGSIYTPYFKYLNEVLKSDTTFGRREKCMDCPAMLYCRGGCKLVKDADMENGMCKLRRAVFQPVLDATIAYGKEIMEADNGQRDNQ